LSSKLCCAESRDPDDDSYLRQIVIEPELVVGKSTTAVSND
jgi:hypothetical protein